MTYRVKLSNRSMNRNHLNHKMIKPVIINGNEFIDERGRIKFVNEFRFTKVKRFYTVENSSTEFIRAWQGHRYEKKYFYVVSGSYRIALIEIKDWRNPDRTLKCETFDLPCSTPQILSVPEGYANGFRALEENSIMLVFSNKSLESSMNDDHRWSPEYFTCTKQVFNLKSFYDG